MDNTKYGKYIITQLKQVDEAPWTNPPQAAGKGRGGRVLFLDSEIIPGAFYVEVALGGGISQKAEQNTKSVAEPHKHDYDEVLAMFGTDLSDPYDLNGEVEFWLGDEKHIITNSCIIFIPRGLMHCPLIYKRADKPILTFTTHQGKMYY
jgi:hypothetical protein